MPEKSDQNMTAEDWFGVGVRIVGLFPLFLGIQQFLYFIDFRLGMSSNEWQGYSTEYDPISYLIYALGYFMFSLGMLRGTPIIVAFAYPSRSVETDEESDSEPLDNND